MSGSNNSEIKRPSISLPASMNDEIEDQLEYGDSKADYIRDAIAQKLERESDSDDTTEE